MIEIHDDFHFLSRVAGIFGGLSRWVPVRIFYQTVTVFISTHHSCADVVIRAGADRHFQVARQNFRSRISHIKVTVNQQAGGVFQGLGMNGF